MSFLENITNRSKKYSISGIDAVIADIVIPMSGHQAAIDIVLEYGKNGAFDKGDKFTINLEQYHQISAAIPGEDKEPHAGGTIPNMLHSIKSILDDSTEATVVSLPGIQTNGRAVRMAAKTSGISILPDMWISQAEEVSTPVSFIFVNNLTDDEKSQLEAEHNVDLSFLSKIDKFVLKSDGLNQGILDKIPEIRDDFRSNLNNRAYSSDSFFLAGSCTRKFDCDTFRQSLNTQKHSKGELTFLLPTHNDFSEEEAKLYHEAFMKAEIVLGNKDELLETFQSFGKHLDSFPLNENCNIEEIEEYLSSHSAFLNDKVVFVSDGKNPASIFDHKDGKAEVGSIDVLPINKFDKQVLGAGDCTASFFYSATKLGYSSIEAGKIAMHGADAVMRQPSAQLPDPKATFIDAIKKLGLEDRTENIQINTNSAFKA